MSQPTLFDEPRARHSDPISARDAARSVSPAVPDLNEAILYAARTIGVPCTAFNLALIIGKNHPDRWDEGTIRTRVSALGKQHKLVKADEAGRSPRGQRCIRWRLPVRLIGVETVPVRSVL